MSASRRPMSESAIRNKASEEKSAQGKGLEDVVYDLLKTAYKYPYLVVWRDDKTKQYGNSTGTDEEWFFKKARIDFFICNVKEATDVYEDKSIITKSDIKDFNSQSMSKEDLTNVFKHLIPTIKIAVEAKDFEDRLKPYDYLKNVAFNYYLNERLEEYAETLDIPADLQDPEEQVVLQRVYRESAFKSYYAPRSDTKSVFTVKKITDDGLDYYRRKYNAKGYGIIRYKDGIFIFKYTPETFANLKMGFARGQPDNYNPDVVINLTTPHLYKSFHLDDNFSFYIPPTLLTKYEGGKLEDYFNEGNLPITPVQLSESDRIKLDADFEKAKLVAQKNTGAKNPPVEENTIIENPIVEMPVVLQPHQHLKDLPITNFIKHI